MKLNGYDYKYTPTDFIECIELSEVNEQSLYSIGCLEDYIFGYEDFKEINWMTYRELVDFVNLMIPELSFDWGFDMIDYHTNDYEYKREQKNFLKKENELNKTFENNIKKLERR